MPLGACTKRLYVKDRSAILLCSPKSEAQSHKSESLPKVRGLKSNVHRPYFIPEGLKLAFQFFLHSTLDFGHWTLDHGLRTLERQAIVVLLEYQSGHNKADHQRGGKVRVGNVETQITSNCQTHLYNTFRLGNTIMICLLKLVPTVHSLGD